MSLIQENEILSLIKQNHRWIDVRAPIEFESGSIPNSVNLPILDTEERRLVGTSYKSEGREKAMELGHQLVSGTNKEEKIHSWLKEIKIHSDSSIYCFRGGLRSQISQTWLSEAKVNIRRVSGGYKLMRHLLMTHFQKQMDASSVNIISGPTGSWKTHLIHWLTENQFLAIDLEKHAHHRGSAFGKLGPQPAQVNFEHSIVKEILDREDFFQKKKILYLEDESRLIGRCVLPEFLFNKMRAAPILWVDEPLEIRIENIYSDYVVETDIVKSQDETKVKNVYEGYRRSLGDIKKRLGLEKYSEIYQDIQFSELQSLNQRNHDSNRIWIGKLLKSYYDPLYFSSLEKRQPITLIKGSTSEIKSFVTQSNSVF